MEFGILFTSHPNLASEPYPHREVHARVTAEIQAAETLGYDTAWVAEHHFSNQYGIMPDVFTYLSGAISQMFIGLSSYCQRRFGHCQRLFPSLNSSLVETSHEGMELLAVELPMEGGGMSVVKLRKMLQPLFDLRQ